MKRCCRCHTELAEGCFTKSARHRDGLKSHCKDCHKKECAEYRSKKPEAAKAASRRWKEVNRERLGRAKRIVVTEEQRRAKRAAKDARRDAAKIRATPAWATDFFVEEAYALAKLRTEMLGFAWHVDHIVPLRSKHVCGLHNEFNLRVIPATENIRKGNRHWPDMPGS